MKGKNVLTVSSQVIPYLEKTEISRMSYFIPREVHEEGGQIRIFMPRFGVINERRHQLHEVKRLSGVNLVIDDTDMPLVIKVASIPKERIQVYFIDNEDYFKRKALTEDKKGMPFEDNDERAMFFVKGVLETIKKLNWSPDIIHIHGWMSALMPLYIKKHYGKEMLFKNSKIVTSVYNESFSGTLGNKMFEKLIQDGFKEKDIEILKDPTFCNLMKVAIDHSDALVIASENLDKELEQHLSGFKYNVLPFISNEGSESHCVNFFRNNLF